MKANKLTLKLQAIGMYVMHLPLYVMFILGFMPGEVETPIRVLFITALVLMAVVAVLAAVNAILSVIAIARGDEDHSKTVMKVKLWLIPWYVINFFMCVVILGIFFNPFMIFAAPVGIGILMGTAYFFMLTTSLPNVAHYVRKVLVNKTEQITARRVITIICHFIFCLDVIGAICYYSQNKKALPPTDGGEVSESE